MITKNEIITITDNIQNNSVTLYELYTALDNNAYALIKLFNKISVLEQKVDSLQYQINDIQLRNNHIPMHY